MNNASESVYSHTYNYFLPSTLMVLHWSNDLTMYFTNCCFMFQPAAQIPCRASAERYGVRMYALLFATYP
jgi:hypothetical protein